MERKNIVLISILILTIFYLFAMIFSYNNYSNSLNSYNSDIYEGFNTLQNLIHKVHNEDSQLYKTLLSKEVTTIEVLRTEAYTQTNHSTSVISDLLNLNEGSQFSSQKLASTIDEYYTLEGLRNRIIEFHKLRLLSKSINYDSQISKLIEEYEKQINLILNDIHEEIEFNKEKNQTFIDALKNDFIIKEIIFYLFYLFSIILILYLFKFQDEFKLKENKEIQILDEDMRKIISYIKKEVSLGNFPTIKELKFHLKISHPTLLLKLNELERNNIISIRKKGRNKHLFLK